MVDQYTFIHSNNINKHVAIRINTDDQQLPERGILCDASRAFDRLAWHSFIPK